MSLKIVFIMFSDQFAALPTLFSVAPPGFFIGGAK